METFRHVEMSDDRLFDRLNELAANNGSWLNADRKASVSHEMSCIVFEQMERYAEQHPEAIDLAEMYGTPAV